MIWHSESCAPRDGGVRRGIWWWGLRGWDEWLFVQGTKQARTAPALQTKQKQMGKGNREQGRKGRKGREGRRRASTVRDHHHCCPHQTFTTSHLPLFHPTKIIFSTGICNFHIHVHVLCQTPILLCLILTEAFSNKWPHRVINLHINLVLAFRGLCSENMKKSFNNLNIGFENRVSSRWSLVWSLQLWSIFPLWASKTYNWPHPNSHNVKNRRKKKKHHCIETSGKASVMPKYLISFLFFWMA